MDISNLYPNVHLTLERISPEEAAEMLQFNTHNRKPKRNPLNKALRDGEWLLNGATIVFGKDGVLLDGQNRLLSCIASGKPIDTIVVRGIDNEAQVTMDCGVKRSLSDFIELAGGANSRGAATVASFMYRYEASGENLSSVVYKNTNDYTIRSIFSYYLKNADHIDFLYSETRKITRRYKGVAIGSTSVLVHCLYESSAEDASYFVEQLVANSPSRNQPINMMRERLVGNSEKRSHEERLSQKQLVAQMVKCWNAFMRGEEIKFLRFREGGANPESFPVVYKEGD